MPTERIKARASRTTGSRARRLFLASVACWSLALNVSCAAARPLPREDQRAAVELKTPRAVVVRRAVGEETFRDILIINGWIATADENSIEMDVHHLTNRNGVRVDLNETVGTTAVSRADVSRIFTLGANWREQRPGVSYVLVGVFLVASVALLVLIWNGLTSLN